MMNKEFDKLSRINTIGFLKILSREYNLDLLEWQEEFEAYWKANREQPDAKENTFALNAPSKTRHPIRNFLLLLIIAGGAFWYFDGWSQVQSYLERTTSQAPQPIAPVVEEAQESLDTPESTAPMVDQENNATAVDEELLPLVEETALPEEGTVNEETIASEAILPRVQEIPEETPEETQETNAQPAENNETQTTSSVVPVILEEATLVPNINIWVGVIYLDTMKRDSFLTTEPIVLDFTQEQIITTGHGNFTFLLEDERQEFTSQLPKRFYVKEGKLEEITYNRFVELNGGSGW
jgi:hypothetical protein